ncbi:hypothetical protein [Pedobacter panaciterrae]|uniref:hypothetical protein n=1 Tax=Pedobacter panaciterrae TaxID=363849 RepID=UPI00259A554B|nr:hypothetical protein [uncultured Pedobacter sp.]
MKKLKWTGTPLEFLELVMFLDTIQSELSENGNLAMPQPTLNELGCFLMRFVEVDLSEFNSSFYDLMMHGKATGFFFHQLLRLRKVFYLAWRKKLHNCMKKIKLNQ